MGGRIAILEAPGRFRLEEVPLPEPGPGEIRVRLEGCGVCGSDLPLWEGRPWFDYPREAGAPGHEGWGRVDGIGPGVQGFAPGERVAVLSFHAYGEYDLSPAASAVRLPPELDGQPIPGEALGCAMNVFARSRIESGQTVGILGVGFLGALLAALCVKAGARVIAVSRRPFALELARELGCAETVCLGEDAATIEAVRELTGGGLCDRVIEATGQQGPLDLAGELCRVRGIVVIAGYHQDGPRRVNLQLWNWRGLDVVNAHERDPKVYVEGLRSGVAALTEGVFDLRRLCTHSFPLEELPRAFETMARRPEGFLKALVVP
jgi:threonine dehydrogenase-like Zn-dependent dehydrogenase